MGFSSASSSYACSCYMVIFQLLTLISGPFYMRLNEIIIFSVKTDVFFKLLYFIIY
jgi:hypothetical protein